MTRGISVALITLALAVAPGGVAARTLVIEGHGYGHGVGMSQWGAEGLALHGWSYRRILAHYYPGTRLSTTGARVVRVLVVEGKRSVLISSREPFRVVDARGRRAVLHGTRRVAGRLRVGKRVLRPPLTFEPGAQPLRVDGTPYRGKLVVAGDTVVDVLRLELYLRGVVSFEMPHRWNPEALKAQAVAARSYTLATLHHGAGFDLYADTRDQMYGGIRAETDATNAAVAATGGQILTWDGRPALTYYFSTSGGRTAAARDVLTWAPDVPYLRSVPDPYDSLSPHHSWQERLRAADVRRRLDLPGLRTLTVRRNGSGRVAEVVARWRGGSQTIAGRTFQHELGLPSTWFTIRGAKTTGPKRARGPAGPRTCACVPTHTPTSTRRGWIVVLASSPVSGPRPQGHVLRSSAYSSLRPGLWVVYRGPYATRAAAAAHAGGGYVKRLAP